MRLEQVWDSIDERFDFVYRDNSGVHWSSDRPVFDGGHLYGMGILEFTTILQLDIEENVVFERPKVEKWIVPTDEHARKRPLCRVKDCFDINWTELEYELVMVDSGESDGYPFVTRNQEGERETWVLCQILEEE